MYSIASQFNYPTLKLGSCSPLVKELQIRLSQQGRPVSVTGYFDYDTELRVKAFQSQAFLPPDGVVGSLTWQVVYLESPINRPVLQYGCSGDEVIAVQELLSIDLYYLGSIDGDFGHATQTAVQRFQRDQGLSIDGVVDYKTWQALSQL